MAFIPCHPDVSCANTGLVEWPNLCAGSRVGECYVWIEAINGLIITDAELREAARSVRSQPPKVIIKGAVLLHQEKDVLNDPCFRGTHSNRR
jgi:hypothetical protein